MNCLVRARFRFERQSLDQTQSDELGFCGLLRLHAGD